MSLDRRERRCLCRQEEQREAAFRRLERDEEKRRQELWDAKRKCTTGNNEGPFHSDELSATLTDSEAAVPQSRLVYDISGGKCSSALLAPRPTASLDPIYLTASLAPEKQNIYLTGSIDMAREVSPPCGSIDMPREVHRSSDLMATERAVPHQGTAEQNIYLTGSIGTATGARSIGMVSKDDLIAAANQLVTVAHAGGLTVRVGDGAVEALLADVQRYWSSSVESSKRECRIHRSAECTLTQG